MCYSQPLTLLTLLATTVLVVSAHPASANPHTNSADLLLPLEDRNRAIEVEADRFQSTVDAINDANQPESEEGKVLGNGFFGNFVGDNGEVNLPLGITVFSTLGDPSIGFGGNFK